MYCITPSCISSVAVPCLPNSIHHDNAAAALCNDSAYPIIPIFSFPKSPAIHISLQPNLYQGMLYQQHKQDSTLTEKTTLGHKSYLGESEDLERFVLFLSTQMHTCH